MIDDYARLPLPPLELGGVGRKLTSPGVTSPIPIVVGGRTSWRGLPGVPVTSDASIEAALEPVKLFEGICKGGCDIGSRFAVQTICLE
jgi:hypothetical protein